MTRTEPISGGVAPRQVRERSRDYEHRFAGARLKRPGIVSSVGPDWAPIARTLAAMAAPKAPAVSVAVPGPFVAFEASRMPFQQAQLEALGSGDGAHHRGTAAFSASAVCSFMCQFIAIPTLLQATWATAPGTKPTHSRSASVRTSISYPTKPLISQLRRRHPHSRRRRNGISSTASASWRWPDVWLSWQHFSHQPRGRRQIQRVHGGDNRPGSCHARSWFFSRPMVEY
jgi:hypothetical protein